MTEESALGVFCAITGAPPAQAQAFLALFDGQLDSAVAAYLDSGSTALPPLPPPPSPAAAVVREPLPATSTPLMDMVSAQEKYLAFRSRIEVGQETIKRYEVREYKLATLETFVDFAAIQTHFKELKEQQRDGSTVEGDDVIFMKALLRWFKLDFFKWCNKPDCECCSEGRGAAMEPLGSSPVTDEERRYGAARCEIYRCTGCQAVARFARFNDPLHLLRTRRGRCGEWANAFCLLCRSLSIDARYVYDFTDHVWVEVYLPSLGRFVHCDPCERALDSPLMYEGGWGKRLTHIIAYSRYGCSDSISRYSRKLEDVVDRRVAEIGLSEEAAAVAVAAVDSFLESTFFEQAFQSSSSSSREGADVCAGLLVEEVVCGADIDAVRSAFIVCIDKELPVGEVIRRKELLRDELLSLRTARATELSGQERSGRQTGDIDWRRARGELGELGELESARGSSKYIRCRDGSDGSGEVVGVVPIASSETQQAAAERCERLLASSTLAATRYSIVSESGGEGRVAVLYADDREPHLELSTGEEPCATSCTSDGCGVADVAEYRLLYLPLGGGEHGDTRAFDGARELLLLASALSGLAKQETPATRTQGCVLRELLECVEVSEIAIFAGSNLCNGCQVTYRIDGVSLPVAADSSYLDSPIARTMAIAPGDRIKRITVNSGSLVDSVVVRTAFGGCLRAGGAGGHNEKVIDCDDAFFSDKKFLGFSGGLGGHLHNLGAIFLCKPGDSCHSSSNSSSSSSSRVDFSPALRKFADSISVSGVHRLKSYSAGRLIRLTHDALITTDRDTVAKSVGAIIAYFSNIAKDPSRGQTKRIKLNNRFLADRVLAAPGGSKVLGLLLGGPVRFLCSEGEFALIFDGSGGDSSAVARDISAYIIYLKAIFNV